MENIEAVVQEIAGNKASGPDLFLRMVNKSHWTLVKRNLYMASLELARSRFGGTPRSLL